jgi:hypothetical protein
MIRFGGDDKVLSVSLTTWVHHGKRFTRRDHAWRFSSRHADDVEDETREQQQILRQQRQFQPRVAAFD